MVLHPTEMQHLRTLEEQLLSLGVREDGNDDLADSATQAICHVQGTGPMSFSTVHFGHGVAQRTPDVDSLRADGWSENAIIALQKGLVRRK
jgi:hypothetical protein